MRQSAAALALAALGLAVSGCHSDHQAAPATAATTPAASALPTTTAPSPTTAPKKKHRPQATHLTTPRNLGAPPFTYATSAVTAAQLGKSWHHGCPVGPASLVNVTMTFWGFDHAAHRGTLVVNRSAVSAITGAFRRMYAAKFPIRQMQPIAAYGGDDDTSMNHDNTSAFNCRLAVSNGPKSWSMHAYGLAVDIDPLENPYRLDGKVLPPAGAPYMDRSNVRPGMVVRGSSPVVAFTAMGWGWGGNWSSTPDYQHFSSNGR